MKSDECLFIEFTSGQEQSLLELIQRYEKKLYYFLYRYVGDSHKAEDLFQETFLQIFTKYKSFDTSKSFRPWLFTIAANLARDDLRKQKRQKTNQIGNPRENGSEEIVGGIEEIVDDHWEEPSLVLEKLENGELLTYALNQLSLEHREVLLLFHFENLKYREISDILNIPIGTIKSRIFNATKQLMLFLQPQSEPQFFSE
ncbi:MAG: RNA polymerase sigma factor [Planctomycetota bacterium]